MARCAAAASQAASPPTAPASRTRRDLTLPAASFRSVVDSMARVLRAPATRSTQRDPRGLAGRRSIGLFGKRAATGHGSRCCPDAPILLLAQEAGQLEPIRHGPCSAMGQRGKAGPGTTPGGTESGRPCLSTLGLPSRGQPQRTDHVAALRRMHRRTFQSSRQDSEVVRDQATESTRARRCPLTPYTTPGAPIPYRAPYMHGRASQLQAHTFSQGPDGGGGSLTTFVRPASVSTFESLPLAGHDAGRIPK